MEKSNEQAENKTCTIHGVIKRGFKKGDKVEIVGNIPFDLKDKPRPLLGRVTRVDGWYVYVKPLWQRWQGEWYPNELRHVL